jgi:hypothetical protein
MITLKEVFNKFSLVKMNSCVQEILCAFSDEYADYLLPVCQQPNLIIDLLKIADSSIPEVYFQENCPDQSTLIAAEKMLIEVTQNKFRARAESQERHESGIPKWIDNDIALLIIDNFIKLNFISEKAPDLQKYPCVALLGSTAPNMQERLDFFVSLLSSSDLEIGTLYLLTGTRTVDPDKYNDGSVEYIQSIKEKFKVDMVTEKELIQDVYDKVCKPDSKCSKMKVKLVNAVKNQGRANTLDTLIEFKAQAENCDRVLYISIAPFIVYQNEIIAKFAKDHFKHEYETVGKGTNIDIGLPKIKIAHYMVMSFAEALYAARSRIKETLNLEEKFSKDDL